MPTGPSQKTPFTQRSVGNAETLEIVFLEGIFRRLPGRRDILEALGHLYTAQGRLEDGLRIDQELVRLTPEAPIAWYNFACSLALTKQPDAAVQALTQAIDLGYDDPDWMQEDTDLLSLHSDVRFQVLLKRIQQKRL